MFTNPQMVDELQASALFTQDSAGLVRIDPAVLVEAARLLDESATPKLTKIQAERDALGWSTFRMSIALRLIRTFGMGGIALPGSGMIRDWLCKWIDHGMDEQLAWPRAVPAACQLLEQWGFQDVQGFIGKKLPTDKRGKVAANDVAESAKADVPHACPACPIEARDIGAVLHNLVGQLERGDSVLDARAKRKLNDAKVSLARWQQVADAHFAATKPQAVL